MRRVSDETLLGVVHRWTPQRGTQELDIVLDLLDARFEVQRLEGLTERQREDNEQMMAMLMKMREGKGGEG